MNPLDKVPYDGDFSSGLVGDLVESTGGKIDRVGVIAGGALISHSNGDGLSVGDVGDEDLLSAEGGGTVVASVAGRIHSGDEGRVGVDVSAGTGDTVLVEEGGDSTGDVTRVAAVGGA